MNYFGLKLTLLNYIGFFKIFSYCELEQTTSDSSEYESSSDESGGSEESSFVANEEGADEQRDI